MIQDTLEEYLLKDIVEILKKGFGTSDANIIIMVDDFTSWNPAHGKADILIHLAGDDPEDDNRFEEIEIQVYLFARSYIGKFGVMAYNSTIKKTLKDQRSIFASGKLIFGGCKFQGTNKGVWNYVSIFRVKVDSCADLKMLLEKKKNLPAST